MTVAQNFQIRRLADGRACLNLGSSARVSPNWNNVDSSWLFRVGRHRRLSRLLHYFGILTADRFARMQRLDRGSVLWNLAKGIPFPDLSFDVVYHSHFLEHVEKESAPAMIRECLRVLRRGGLLRVVVP
ncbi:MAG: class I SAM-dependent methyltransferase, partial [Terriglobia bacterium]